MITHLGREEVELRIKRKRGSQDFMKYEKRVREVSKMQEHGEEASGAQKGQTWDTVEARQADQFGQNIKLEV